MVKRQFLSLFVALVVAFGGFAGITAFSANTTAPTTAVTSALPGWLIEAMAESGCAAWPDQPFRTGTEVRGKATFSCAIGDTGSRTLQSCIVQGSTWWDCDTAYPGTDDWYIIAECYSPGTGSTMAFRTWYYFKGEDGSESSGYSSVKYTYPCTSGID